VQEKSWGTLKPGGMLVSITDRPSEDRAKAEGKRAGFVFIGPNAPILTDLAQMVDAGQVRPIIGAEYGLNDTAKAQEASETGRATGKIVIYVGHP
jgi:NADPH:quinone reductase-like Zn-dependent oxidoreductase